MAALQKRLKAAVGNRRLGLWGRCRGTTMESKEKRLERLGAKVQNCRRYVSRDVSRLHITGIAA